MNERLNEQHFAYKIRQQLNRGLHDLSPADAIRLAAGRQRALTAQKPASAQPLLAAANAVVHFQIGNLPFRQFAMSVVVLVCLVFSALWMADQRVAELGTVDTALLTDDLPIAAFTDKGFDAWLKSTAPR